MTETQDRIFVGGGGADQTAAQELLLRYGNRHGLITGATGTGKTVTMQILVEGFSAAGVPVFVADVKGDVSGVSRPGDPAGKAHDALTARAAKIGLTGFDYRACPTVFWDLFGVAGHPVRTTISEMGPLLLARMFDLTEVQEGVLNIAFRVADDDGLALLDLADLRAMLVWLGDNSDEVGRRYGNVATASIGAIQRQLLILENQGGTALFGEPALALSDMITVTDGVGQVNVLMADKLMQSPRLYAMFLLWMLSELFEDLPEIGNPDKPVMVFFFDEAHLLFDEAPKALIDRIEQVVRLIRSKGVGIYFVTQAPDDVPEDVLAQLGNRIQHALRAFTPRDAKALKAAATTFRPNPAFDTETAIREVGTGEAVVSLLEDKAVPAMVQRTLIRPPQSRMGPITDAERAESLTASPLAGKYETAVDRESASEILAARAASAAAEVDAQAARADDLFGAGGAAPAGRVPGSSRRYTPETATRSRPAKAAEPGLGEVLAKTMIKQLSSRQGQRFVRGVLGSLFKGR
ncbi:helicase HerA-like domain-containing protein [Pseudoruegeria sp. SK021]|uniref:helicase HerA-like domain-containing protein n=1 Tax=Pseudoruegeria sp. SK021 TaxID=1933035 RepID=UPI000A2311B9|nr:helicase HerA-like domain-containing protein [Pseudoruegeria sp. SK021]OSP53750.1 ATP-binding protein [Pseudoruegeria sp. SK021]